MSFTDTFHKQEIGYDGIRLFSVNDSNPLKYKIKDKGSPDISTNQSTPLYLKSF